MLEGGGLTGNVIDDWVNAVTQGEYTKYDDVPEAKSGENPGWTKGLRGVSTYRGSSMDAVIINSDTEENFEIFKDSVWDTNPK